MFLIFYPKSFLLLSLAPSWGTGVRNCHWHLLCVWDKSQSYQHSRSPGCPNHQNSTDVPPLVPCMELICTPWCLPGPAPFPSISNSLLTLSPLSATEILDSLRPKAAATRQWDTTPLRRGYPQPPGQHENPRKAPALLEISLNCWGVTREMTLLKSQ
jgi:hypothetical protein